MKTIKLFSLCILFYGLQSCFSRADVTTFDNGSEGWGVFFDNDGTQGDFLETSKNNPGAHLRSMIIDSFGMSFHNQTNANFLGDYQRFGTPLEIKVDVRVELLNFFGVPVSRNLILEMVDFNPPGSDYPYVSVWYNLGEISASQTGSWTTFSVLIEDPTSTSLPTGWGGTGAEDPSTFEPILPADRTFASVLQNVQEIRFTTFEPGFFYGFTDFHLRYDNPSLIAVPEPTGFLLCVGFAIAALGSRQRR